MGFFDKLKSFFTSNDDDDLNAIISNRKKLEKSVNYNFTHGILKELVTHPDFKLDKYFDNDEESRNMVLLCLTAVKSAHHLKITDDYLLMPIHFVSNEYKKAIILEVPNNKLECECNLVGIVEDKNHEISYYTNEYYKDLDSYGLCLQKNDIRFSLNAKPQNYEEFKTEILKYTPKSE